MRELHCQFDLKPACYDFRVRIWIDGVAGPFSNEVRVDGAEAARAEMKRAAREMSRRAQAEAAERAEAKGADTKAEGKAESQQHPFESGAAKAQAQALAKEGGEREGGREGKDAGVGEAKRAEAKDEASGLLPPALSASCGAALISHTKRFAADRR